ncbi:MAG TPA: hypothetical protein VL201_04365 [Patescibacteria group bacterium]|nr:hypothetical protein [Patescibacteria group bacterium]
MLSTIHTINNMQPKSPVINISWKIVFVMQCAQNNSTGCAYLHNFSFDRLSKDNNFSFLHKPFQINKNSCLINPVTSKYDLEVEYAPLMYHHTCIEEARITCTGNVSAGGIFDNYSINPAINLLEAILIAMVKEHLIEQNYINLQEKSISSYTLDRKGTLKKIIQNELSYAGFETPKTKERNDFVTRYFPTLLAKDQSFVKKIYSDLCSSNFIDKNAKIACEICNVSVTVENNLKRNSP